MTTTYYSDSDGDNYGISSTTTQACTLPNNYAVASDDCNDNNNAIYPGAAEVCNGVDDDCSGGVPASEYDVDGDGYRVCQNDCNDLNNNINPGRTDDTCNGVDDDCDNSYDEGIIDSRISVTGLQNDFICSSSNSYGTCTGTGYRTCPQTSLQTWGSLQSCNAATPTAYGC